jgi:hypothetical protein
MRSRNRRLCGNPRCLGQTGSRFGKTCSVLGEPLLACLSGDRTPKALAAKVGRKTTTKGRKPLATTHVARCSGMGGPNRLSDRNPGVRNWYGDLRLVLFLFHNSPFCAAIADLHCLPRFAAPRAAAASCDLPRFQSSRRAPMNRIFAGVSLRNAACCSGE